MSQIPKRVRLAHLKLELFKEYQNNLHHVIRRWMKYINKLIIKSNKKLKNIFNK